MMFLVLLLCQKNALMQIVDAMTDWKEAGVEIALYGYTEQAKDGFILMNWKQKPSEEFLRQQVKDDPAIFDHLVCSNPFTQGTGPA